MSDLVERLERIIRAGGAIDPETAELARDEIERLRVQVKDLQLAWRSGEKPDDYEHLFQGSDHDE